MRSSDNNTRNNTVCKNPGVNSREQEVKSVHMKSAIAFKLMSNVKEKMQDHLVKIDPYEKLDKTSKSYQQLKKNPVSYKVI